MKDVQRKLDLSLEDLVEEQKTNGGGKGGGRKRRRPSPEPRREPEPRPERREASAPRSSREPEASEAKEPVRRRDWVEEPKRPRKEAEAPEVAGARKTGRPPQPAAAPGPMPYPVMPGWPAYDPRHPHPAWRPMAPHMYPARHPAPVFRPPAYGAPPHMPVGYPPAMPGAAPAGHRHPAAPAPAYPPGQLDAPASSSAPRARSRRRERGRDRDGQHGREHGRHSSHAVLAAAPAGQPPPHGYQVRLSNIPPELTARDLAEAFAEVSGSRIESVDLLRDGSGRATGEAVIIFAAMPDAQNAVRRYHGGDLNGRRLEAVYEGEVNTSSKR